MQIDENQFLINRHGDTMNLEPQISDYVDPNRDNFKRQSFDQLATLKTKTHATTI